MNKLIIEVSPPKHWERHAKFETLEPILIGDVFIPSGYRSDGASVTRWYAAIGLCFLILALLIDWSGVKVILVLAGSFLVLVPVIFPRVGVDFVLAIMHDYLIDSGQTWAYANSKFYEALIATDIPKWRAKAMLYGVSIGGGCRAIKKVWDRID